MGEGFKLAAVGELIFWGVLGVAGFVLLAIVAWCVRRWTVGTSRRDQSGIGGSDALDLETLQRLRQSGKITEQEFKALRAATIRALDRVG